VPHSPIFYIVLAVALAIVRIAPKLVAILRCPKSDIAEVAKAFRPIEFLSFSRRGSDSGDNRPPLRDHV